MAEHRRRLKLYQQKQLERELRKGVEERMVKEVERGRGAVKGKVERYEVAFGRQIISQFSSSELIPMCEDEPFDFLVVREDGSRYFAIVVQMIGQQHTDEAYHLDAKLFARAIPMMKLFQLSCTILLCFAQATGATEVYKIALDQTVVRDPAMILGVDGYRLRVRVRPEKARHVGRFFQKN